VLILFLSVDVFLVQVFIGGLFMKNPVAKYARTFTKAVVYKDRKRLAKAGYQKHKRPTQRGPFGVRPNAIAS